MLCPVCETENGDGVLECSRCGKTLSDWPEPIGEVVPVPGLEQTIQERVDPEVSLLAGLEQTQVAPPDLPVAAEMVPDVVRTPIEVDAGAPLNWTAGRVDLDRGRDEDHDPRTPAPPDDGLCPWCNAPATGAVCDNCGRRRSRYSAPPTVEQRESSDLSVLCPACFSRVAPGPRCAECGVPFPVVEL